ncbi:helix-turn-helix domain-containing protein [Rhodococcus sp. NPDC019627]|uniref:helix-turn-helix domain-containing protein n=1 Tax=unclassified Rhodococcus (in: high G+C Gram-positive bacteria) TaxID=192944 RepID=UPI0033E191BD
MVWLDIWDAQRFVGRSPDTLHRWRKAGLVKVGKRRGQWYFDKDSLRAAKKEARRRMLEHRVVPGPGRGRAHQQVEQGVLF